jgi:uncharacterized protein YbcI
MARLAEVAQRIDESRESPNGALLAAVSNTVVGLYKRLYGKGPTKARSYYLDGMVVTVLSGGLTRAETTLVESGRADLVTRQRYEFRQALSDDFAEAVGEVLGRPVIAFMSTMHYDPDVSVEVFVLEEHNGAEPSS